MSWRYTNFLWEAEKAVLSFEDYASRTMHLVDKQRSLATECNLSLLVVPFPCRVEDDKRIVHEGVFLSRASLYKVHSPVRSSNPIDVTLSISPFLRPRGNLQKCCYYLLPGLSRHSNTILTWNLEEMGLLCYGTRSIERFLERSCFIVLLISFSCLLLLLSNQLMTILKCQKISLVKMCNY